MCRVQSKTGCVSAVFKCLFELLSPLFIHMYVQLHIQTYTYMHTITHMDFYILVYKDRSLVHAQKHKACKVQSCFESRMSPGGFENGTIMAFYIIT